MRIPLAACEWIALRNSYITTIAVGPRIMTPRHSVSVTRRDPFYLTGRTTDKDFLQFVFVYFSVPLRRLVG
jgi:hypothetical protein